MHYHFAVFVARFDIIAKHGHSINDGSEKQVGLDTISIITFADAQL
jgi:hypothetical protein